MNALLAVPLELRLAALVALGVGVGSALNWAIYALAWKPRPISPWQRPDPKAPPRQVLDRLPVIGWLGLWREAELHGPAFWIRPLLIEVACGAGLAALYGWEVTGQLLPAIPGLIPPPPALQPMLHQQFVAHAALIALMLAATFIDFDEKTIPDQITIPGTLLGLLLAACWPASHLPVVEPGPLGAPTIGSLLLTSTGAWPAWLDSWRGLALAIGGFVAWCLALAPAVSTFRWGYRRGFQYYFASLRRHGGRMILLAVVGSLLIGFMWTLGGHSWRSLLTAITGLVGGGGLIWAVRVVGKISLRKEAMGFGDVTLMAMIGSFLGWQPCLIVFFLSPFAALIVAVAQWLVTRRHEIAFGPYLSLAAVAVIVWWDALWNDFAALIFAAGWLVPAIVLVCLVLMMGLLMCWRIIEQLLFGRQP